MSFQHVGGVLPLLQMEKNSKENWPQQPSWGGQLSNRKLDFCKICSGHIDQGLDIRGPRTMGACVRIGTGPCWIGSGLVDQGELMEERGQVRAVLVCILHSGTQEDWTASYSRKLCHQSHSTILPLLLWKHPSKTCNWGAFLVNWAFCCSCCIVPHSSVHC